MQAALTLLCGPTLSGKPECVGPPSPADLIGEDINELDTPALYVDLDALEVRLEGALFAALTRLALH
jgi:hypothetical protein